MVTLHKVAVLDAPARLLPPSPKLAKNLTGSYLFPTSETQSEATRAARPLTQKNTKIRCSLPRPSVGVKG